MSVKYLFCILILFLSLKPVYSSELQVLIDKTPVGGVVPLVSGKVYHGNFVINKPVVINGMNSVVLDGDLVGTVLTIKANNTVIKNIKIINSGNSHDRMSSAIRVLSSHNTLQNITVRDSLFGFDFKESHDNKVLDNDISSKNVDLGVRGDGIRLWASNRNIFRRNKIHDSRDMVIWYSYDNIIEDNKGWNNRYSLHFMYTGKSTVKRNDYRNNAVGIFLMYSEDSTLADNKILFSQGGTGMGIGLKEVDNMVISNNEIIYCSVGIYLDQSPFKVSAYNRIEGNTIGFNQIGISFHSTLERNIFKGNAVIENLQDIEVHANGHALNNVWEGNYWSSYQGFDRNYDGYGDSKFSSLLYMDQLWLNDPWIKFFFASPVLSVINFLARLAPFDEPRLLLTDIKPVFKLNDELRLSAKNLFYDLTKLNLDFDEDDDGSGDIIYEEDESDLEGYTSE